MMLQKLSGHYLSYNKVFKKNEALNTKKKKIRYKMILGTKVKHETLCYREGQISNNNDKMMLFY